MKLDDFFRLALGKDQQPFPYQRRLAEGSWPDVLTIPTGLGKTAAVLMAWLWRRLDGDPGTPRRFVYCLPMRVLVEQVEGVAKAIVAQVTPAFEDRGLVPPRVAVVMGGGADRSWAEAPEQPVILVGTQDMLLSRALLRGYGMSRYRWPVEFAFLHTDALWVFDEVQLMGAGRATSAQLEAFRRLPALAPRLPSRTLWVSATLAADWLATVDFAPHHPLERLGLDADTDDPDTAHAVVRQRVGAAKALDRAQTVLSAENSKARAVTYAHELAAEIRAAHRPGTTTLVILNRVDRAQAVFAALKAGAAADAPSLLLIHSRFRQRERKARDVALRQTDVGAQGRIVVATQAIEAGVDMTSATLFTELAPLASLIQRCGRCNRYGEEADARVIWIDMAELRAQPALALPYGADDLLMSRERLPGLADASPQTLAKIDLPADDAAVAVLRRKDLIELFNTDPDLSGFDIDISPYVRDADDTDVLVFWRTIDKEPSADASRPMREELCPVAVGRFREFLKRRAGAFVWDGLDKCWVRLDPARLRPGLTILLDSTLGGYDPDLGFSADSKATVEPVAPAVATAPPPEAMADDRRSMLRCYVGLGRHLAHAEAEAERLCAALDRGIEANGTWQAERAAVVRAARWHDVGKAHPVFQNAIVDCPDQGKMRPAGSLAKSACRMQGYGRKFFRHELASALAWLAHGDAGGGVGGASDVDVDPDLVAYLIAAHHGKVRLGIRALPGEREPNNPRDGRLFARGIWHGDALPAVDVGGKEWLPPVQLSLAPMVLGDGASGRSWAARTQRLLARHGPFRLAWLEALVRIADWRASAAEQDAGDDDV